MVACAYASNIRGHDVGLDVDVVIAAKSLQVNLIPFSFIAISSSG
jgi:hypothetical protein